MEVELKTILYEVRLRVLQFRLNFFSKIDDLSLKKLMVACLSSFFYIYKHATLEDFLIRLPPLELLFEEYFYSVLIVKPNYAELPTFIQNLKNLVAFYEEQSDDDIQ